MIEFMVISEPRSGSTWLANLLTTDETLCFHDLLAHRHYEEWDSIKSYKTLGVSDTGISQFWQWLNAHPARKVILHRSRKEIASSLGMPGVMDMPENLGKIDGMHVHWTDIFNDPAPIYEHLLHLPFDFERHAALKQINMQPHTASIQLNKPLVRRLINEARRMYA
jgi:hypothetical protein